MITLCDKETYPHDELCINLDTMQLKLNDLRYKKGIIGYHHHAYDLSQLMEVKLCYEYPDVTRRQHQAQAKTNQNRASNAVIGAFGGALIDSLFGEDDGIIDGALIGAAAGAAVTPVEQINFKENSVHFALLLFKDGESLTAKVDVRGYTDILRALHKAVINHSEDSPIHPIQKIDLTSDQLKIAEVAAKDKVISEKQVGASLLGVSTVLLAAIGLMLGMLEWFAKSFQNVFAMNKGESDASLIIFSGNNIIIGLGLVALFAGLTYYLYVQGYRSALDSIQRGEGQPKFARKT